MIRESHYLIITLVLSSSILAGVFALNAMVDPFWFFKGNQLGDRNFVFNERISKTVQFWQSPELYDCVILGTSNLTVVPFEKNGFESCFNYSISGGTAEEFGVILQHLSTAGVKLERVIIGVDFLNLYRVAQSSLPAFIKERTEVPPASNFYLSFDALGMAFRSIRDDSPLPRYYDKEFHGQVDLSHLPFEIPQAPSKLSPIEVNPKLIETYQSLPTIYPNARFTALVPPMSAWHFAEQLHRVGVNPYVDSLSAIASKYDDFIDFSLPSQMTYDVSSTYDGLHYLPQANRQIAEALRDESQARFGVNYKAYTNEEIVKIVEVKLEEFRQRQPHFIFPQKDTP